MSFSVVNFLVVDDARGREPPTLETRIAFIVGPANSVGGVVLVTSTTPPTEFTPH